MARTKEVVESHLKKATDSVQSYVSSLSKDKQEKKVLHHDPKWRQLNAAAKKFARQITFIDRRNKKPEVKAEG
jgi:hypothetical protein